MAPLPNLKIYREILSFLDSSDLDKEAFAVVPDSGKAYLISGIWFHTKVPTVVLCPSPEDARELSDRLRWYLGAEAPVFQFAETEVLPFERMSVEPRTVRDRIECLGALLSWTLADRKDVQPPLIVVSAMGAMQKTMSPVAIRETAHTLRVDDEVRIERLMDRWIRMGYTITPSVEEPGTIARRGGIVDIYSPAHEWPIRIDFWGDFVDSIRIFDPTSQLSDQKIDEVTVLPASEILTTGDSRNVSDSAIAGLDFRTTNSGVRDRIMDDLSALMADSLVDGDALYAGFFLNSTLLDHLRMCPDAQLLVVEPSETTEAAVQISNNCDDRRLTKENRGDLPSGFPSILIGIKEFESCWNSDPKCLNLTRYQRAETSRQFQLPLKAAEPYHGDIDRLCLDLDRKGPACTVLATQNSQRVGELLREASLGVRETNALPELPSDGAIPLIHSPVDEGWSLFDPSSESINLLTLLTDRELFGRQRREPRRVRRSSKASGRVPSDHLQEGQFVVHIDHGIGKFVGTINREAAEPGGGAEEYLVLEYADGDKLYVPMAHLDRIAPYSGGNDNDPSPTRLGTQEWARTVARARTSTKKLAFDLLGLYAKRAASDGFSHLEDTHWQKEMEDSFPYYETMDQLEAIHQVKQDLEAPKPMDRLICGDVGYGKTEVALRAAFKAVMSGKQVAILVPTTVLAQQHFSTFSGRLTPFPIAIEVLSRFKTPNEQEAIVGKLKAGDIDIVIGTHRLVQKDVAFKNLGLVIIDEEHRFGVHHKERLKEIRADVDVLTMTATPIPRTLHMAVSGIRDISTIETPPDERLPIKTYLAERSDDIAREAILREIDRNGQVYYLHNRVQSIELVAAHLRSLVPEARVIVGHGQMPEDRLIDVMDAFSNREADVLVCTTIIESGLDVPAVNTLIVEHAERFGLAQLYQLRGRIGRRSRRGYAYLLVEPGRRPTESAQRRLKTIVAATELGAGFHIAVRDLEIRGAGNLLGAEQSGQIQSVGFDLYSRLLGEAVTEIRATTGMGPALPEPNVEPTIDLGLPASIPEQLVPHMPTRMDMYHAVANAKTLEDVDGLVAEFHDRLGLKLPDETHYLFYYARVKILARMARADAVVRQRDHIRIQLKSPVGDGRLALEKALGHGIKVGNQQIHMDAQIGDGPWGQALIELLRGVAEFNDRLDRLMTVAT